jgi:hypothetical protein
LILFFREIFQRPEATWSVPSAGIVSYDEISLIDVFVARRDGASGYFNFKPSRSQQRRQTQRMKSNAMQNRDPGVHQTFIPRTQRPPKEQVCNPKNYFINDHHIACQLCFVSCSFISVTCADSAHATTAQRIRRVAHTKTGGGQTGTRV